MQCTARECRPVHTHCPHCAALSVPVPFLMRRERPRNVTRSTLPPFHPSIPPGVHSHPAVQAARTVLHSQLLSGGLKLVRDGEVLTEVKYGEKGEDGFNKKGITSHFNQHLEEHWLPFAKDVVDCFIKWGVCPVVFDLLEEHPSVEAISRLKSENGISLGKRQRPKAAPPKLVPHVPLLGTYEIAWKPRGKYGYAREYIVYNNAPGQATRLDEEALVFVRQHPDSVGNCNSPLATVYEQGSFVQAMTELAFNAEITRSQPQIVTQLRKPERGSQLDAGALFFDNESRTLNNEQDGQESGQAARSLEMQAQLCKVINSLQTRGQGGPSAGGGGGGIGGSDGRAPFAPPDIPPKLFTLPKDHELAPNLQVPQPRADLEALIRLGIDSFCSALGVPAALVFEGKFSNNSTTQCALGKALTTSHLTSAAPPPSEAISSPAPAPAPRPRPPRPRPLASPEKRTLAGCSFSTRRWLNWPRR
jgi:hypothetical protein